MDLSRLVDLCCDSIRRRGQARATITLTQAGCLTDAVGGITAFTPTGPMGSVVETTRPRKGKGPRWVVAIYSAKDMLETLMEHDLV